MLTLKVLWCTTNWKKVSSHEYQLNASENTKITEMLNKYQLRGHNKNYSLILSPFASAKFISLGEVFL